MKIARKLLSVMLSTVMLLSNSVMFTFASGAQTPNEPDAQTSEPTAVFSAETLSGGTGKTYDRELSELVLSYQITEDGYSDDHTRFVVEFDTSAYPTDFSLLKSSVIDICYRSNITTSKSIDLNPHPGSGNRLWSASLDATYNGEWQRAIVDLSEINWSGGEQLGSTAIKYPADGSDDTFFELNFGGVMNKLTLKMYRYNDKKMNAGDYADIRYIAFFDSIEAANEYTYEKPASRIENVTVGNVALGNFGHELGDAIDYNEAFYIEDFFEDVYKRTGVYVEKADAETVNKIIISSDDSDSTELLNSIDDGEFAIKTVNGNLIIVSKTDYGVIMALRYITKAFLGGDDESFTADSVNIDFGTAYVGNRDRYITYNTENVKTLDYILSVPEETEVGTMKVNGLVSPLGLDDTTPEFEWYINSVQRGEKQKNYRLVIAESVEKLALGEYVLDSGIVNSADMKYAISDSTVLKPETEYFWQVMLNTSVSGDIVSKSSSFETGVMDTTLSGAKWIAPSYDKTSYNSSTKGTVVYRMKFIKNEAAVVFGCNADDTEYIMWQLNATDSYSSVTLRPHVYNGGWAVYGAYSLESVFPSKEDAYNDYFTMKLEIDNGKIDTYINDTFVNTITLDTFEIGYCKARPGYESWIDLQDVFFYDSEGTLVNSNSYKKALPMFRRDFEAKGEIVKARLYASALGFYNVEINGVRVNDSYLNPGQTAYDDRIFYQTYDITDVLTSNNAISVTMGDGFYHFRHLGSQYAFIAKLVITYADGTQDVIFTDDLWQYYEYGPVLSADIYYGEHYDARRTVPKASTYGECFDWKTVQAFTTSASAIIPATIVAEEMEPVRNVITYTPIGVKKIGDGSYVYDFGQNIAGTVRVTASAPSGTKITLIYGEYTDDKGVPVTGYFLNHNGPDSYIFAGLESETYCPDLVFHGFRYLRIDGLDGPLDFENVEGLVLSCDMRQTVAFESSSNLLNRYQQNTVWSQRGNFISNITDCPTREKNGWTGDAQMFVKAGAFNMDARNVYENYLSMIRSSMSPNGAVPEIVPVAKGATDNTKTPSGWSDAIVTIPYELYMQYGDISLLTDNYESMKAWISYLLKFKIDDENGDYVRHDGFYGDHLSYNDYVVGEGYYEESVNEWRKTSFSEVGTAFTAYSCSIIAKVSEILGNEEDVKYYTDLYNKFAKAWRDNFLEEDGITSKASTQTSYVMGIYYDLYENTEKKAAAVEKLCEQIEADGGQTVGFIGMPDLYNTLSENGKTDVAYKLLLNTKTPSLLYPVTKGATTTWESYNGGSNNHFVFGTPVKWAYTDILGIDHRRDVNNAGYKNFTLEPKIGFELTYANGTFESASGIIRSGWKLTEKGYVYECTVPANTSAKLTLPSDGKLVTITESGAPLANAYGVSGVSYGASGVSMKLDAGVYSFDVEYSDLIYGDVNGDSDVNIVDGIILARHLGGWTGYGEEVISALASDVDCDGEIGSADVVVLMRHFAKWKDYDNLPYVK